MLVSGRTAQTQIMNDSAFWSETIKRWFESGRPFRDLDGIAGNRSELFQEWLSHPEPDEYWDKLNPSAAEYGRIQMPILTITGSYDDDQPGALEHYKQHLRHARSDQHYLVIGPWDHLRASAVGRPSHEFGGLRVGSESAVDLAQLHLDWYRWTMGGGPRPEFLKRPVAFYVMGEECWRYADTLEEITVRHESYFLDSSSNANDVFSSGSLDMAVGKGEPDSYTYDPREAYEPYVAAESSTAADSLTDQSVTLSLSGRQLVYHSAPLRERIEISGFFRLTVWISIDCPDTDLYASVYEIDRAGRSLRLSTDAIRARYRMGLRAPQLIETREPLRYDFERFTFVSRMVERFHRLRLVIAPVGRLVETNFTQKNYNAGGAVADEGVEDGTPVTVKLFHNREFPSVLHVPLGSSR
jgi:putative CocE/NonD family hydrolase